MDLKNKKVTIFGLGQSGVAVARRLSAMGAIVTGTDVKAVLDEALPNIKLELGGHTLAAIAGADLIVVSPGVHLDIPVLKAARKRNITIIPEIELAASFLTKPVIAVTGTNGKTTTTTLIGEMLLAGGKKVAVAGNIGAPLIDVDDSGLDYVAAEISSYQLEAIDKFKPWISIILNIQPDHLERHHTLEEYVKQKARIFRNQTSDDYLVYNEDDPAVVKMIKNARTKKIGFSQKHTEIITLKPAQIKIPGRHNLANALAAAQAAYLCGVDQATVAAVLQVFPGVEHRIEFVTKFNGVEFYNDSKATNPDSTLAAIVAFAGRGIVLILGGRDKGVPLEALVEAVKHQVKAVVLIGEATERFEPALKREGYNNIVKAGSSMAAAVAQARSLAESGEIVLLSPACASFDMFQNYEERGRVFKTICQNLN